jgi:predicted adenylyl cyclase CyaB
MREIELKSVVPDEESCVRRLQAAGAECTFVGRLQDRRYDTRERTLCRRDVVLRLRVAHDGAAARATLDWKGPTALEDGYKQRDEESVDVADAGATAAILRHLGYEVIREVDREVTVFRLPGATVRFERFPRMDVLVEVEGAPAAIERAIVALALPRQGFTPERLADWIARFEQRTGQRAAVSEREARGDYRYAVDDA